MTTTVLVPVDGSDKDQRTLAAAAAVAELAGGDLHLIRVLDVPIESLSSRARTMGALDAARAMRIDMERSVHGLAARLIADTGRRVTAEVAEGFDVARVLVDRSAAPGVELVVMATRAASPIGRAVRGSVADRVMRESPRPVVLVPPGAGDEHGRQVRLGRVLVPLDGSDLAQRAIDHLLALPTASNLQYVLVEVLTGASSGDSGVAPAPDQAERRLRIVADRLRATGATDVRVRVVEAADPAAAINQLVRAELADLIAMSTRGESGLKRVMLGSVAERVLRHSEVPVLLVTAGDASPA